MADQADRGTGEGVDAVVKTMHLLADGTRLKILHLLASRGELNVTTLCELMGARQPTVSHHLGILRAARVVHCRRDGRGIYYSLGPVTSAPAADTVRITAGGASVMVDLVLHPVGARAPQGIGAANRASP